MALSVSAPPNVVKATATVVVAAPGAEFIGHRPLDGNTLIALVRLGDRMPPIGRPSDPRVVARVTNLPNGWGEVSLRAPYPLQGHEIRRVANGVEIRISFSSPYESLRGRLRSAVPEGVPSPFIARRFREAERYIRRGYMDRASKELRTLETVFSLNAWARFRETDVHVLAGAVAPACSGYAQLAEEFRARTVGYMSQLRSFVLNCDPDAGENGVDWKGLLAHVARSRTPLRRFLTLEVRWALSWATEPDTMAFIVDELLAIPAYRRVVSQDVLRVLVSRAIEADSSYECSEAFLRHRALVRSHPEGAFLDLRAAACLLELGLPNEATELLTPLTIEATGLTDRTLWKRRGGRARALLLLAMAHQRAGYRELRNNIVARIEQEYPGMPIPQTLLTDAPESELPLRNTLRAIPSRLEEIREAIEADTPSPETGERT